ncbi:conserved hypothetical protein [Gloeothece citriformis PCC 7424]|uniref:Uncharacterized protein n=1 Tax=Gloeothece citriformis (strain PCC 7424) TaxID=65393 RepID=B7KL92_GLOC7|nr:hypothetical protein [Gloeothece citriformis]ACK72464.1 conserved hypothetical protein [Gloeothece citriformis PCC 7424]
MGRLNQLIDQLETLHQQDIKNSAQVYGITAILSSRLQEILTNLNPSEQLLSSGKITQEEIIAKYGNYNNAYNAYKQAYGIKCKKGWTSFLAAIQGLTPPITLEQRVEKLEATVKELVQVLLENK